MDLGKDRPLLRFRLSVVLYAVFIASFSAVLVLALFTDFFVEAAEAVIPPIVWFCGGVIVLAGVIVSLARITRLLESSRENAGRLEKVIDSLERIRGSLTQIDQNTRLSETARAIAFRDAERQCLREAVFDKLQQKDFETAYEVIDEIAHSTIYQELAKQLRAEADKYRSATDQERVGQVMAHIEKLFENYQWVKASDLIERLVKSAPESEKAKALRQKLLDKKDERKKVLLTAWDDAVKRQATNRSLEILRELDQYLTPNEGLALQEAARDAFKTKLHNLGVQFSLAVSGKQWDNAFRVGEEIIRNFPNSTMAGEIREKIDILKSRVGQPG